MLYSIIEYSSVAKKLSGWGQGVFSQQNYAPHTMQFQVPGHSLEAKAVPLSAVGVFQNKKLNCIFFNKLK